MIDFRRLIAHASATVGRLWSRSVGAYRASRMRTGDLNRRLVSRLAPRRFPSFGQLRYAGTVLSAAEMRTVRIAGGLAAFSLLIMGGRLWTVHVVPVPARGGEYVEAVVGSPALPNPLFPAVSDVDADLVRLMYAGVVKTAADGRIVPDLAESYEASDDGKEYVFRLKERLTWHDGEPLTADDVLFTVNLVQNEDYKSPLYIPFRGVRAERVDDRTVRFTLPRPSSAFLTLMTLGILPAHVWREVPPAGITLAEYNLKPVGAGPYRFKSLVRDKVGTLHSYTMERFAAAATPALLDRITLRFYPDMDSAVGAVVAKQADGIGFVPLEMRTRVQVRPDLDRHTVRLPQLTAIFLNQKRNAILKDEAVRQALVAATPRERIIAEVLQGEADAVESPLLQGMPGYDASLKQAAYDPGAAKAALEKAGYVLETPTSTVRVKTKNKIATTLSLTLTTVDRPENVTAANLIADAWRVIGVETVVAPVSADKIQEDALRGHAYDALLFGEVSGPDADPYPFWHSSQSEDGGFNLALYANRSADDLLAEGRIATSTEVRAAAYAAFAKKVVADAPAVFLYSPRHPYYVTREVKGVRLDVTPSPADRFAGIDDWYIKTRRAWR